MPSWNLQSEQVFYVCSASIEGAMNAPEQFRCDSHEEARNERIDGEHIFKVTEHVKVEMLG